MPYLSGSGGLAGPLQGSSAGGYRGVSGRKILHFPPRGAMAARLKTPGRQKYFCLGQIELDGGPGGVSGDEIRGLLRRIWPVSSRISSA